MSIPFFPATLALVTEQATQLSLWGGAVEGMCHRKGILENILVAPCFKIWLSYVTFLLTQLGFFYCPLLWNHGFNNFILQSNNKRNLLFVTLAPQCVTEVVYQRAWNQDVSWKLNLAAWWRTLSRIRILSWSRVPSNLLQKNVIIDLEVLKTAACPSPHKNSTALIKFEKILHLMALKPLRINASFALHNFCNALRF